MAANKKPYEDSLQTCPFCKSMLEANATYCPTCGNKIPSETKSTTRSNNEMSEGDIFGIAAIILSGLGCLQFLPVIGSIIGIVLGAIGLKREKGNITSKVGLGLGILGLVIIVIFAVIIVLVIVFFTEQV
ncbi:MAG: DUF4190 domain-containing protein [Asgard group archaeon]|nr:DUF4190 domain-containing protein [Asgard group archaeon]